MTNAKVRDQESQEEFNDFCFYYMKQWYDDENWTDFNIAFNSGDQDLAAYILVQSGAIDSKACTSRSNREVERAIEAWAKVISDLSSEERAERYNKVFGGCKTYSCGDCNRVSFVNDGNDELYEEELKECWDCGSKNVNMKVWK